MKRCQKGRELMHHLASCEYLLNDDNYASEIAPAFSQVALEQLTLDDLVSALQTCRKRKDLSYAKHVHRLIKDMGLEAHKVIGNYLVPMLAECGNIAEAQDVFQRLVHRSEHAWTSLIQASVESGDFNNAFEFFQQMQENSISVSRFTLQALLKACARLRCKERGQVIHSEIVKAEFEQDVYIGSTLVDMYTKCCALVEAQEVFNELNGRDVVPWTALIGGYAEQGLVDEAFKCLKEMRSEGVSPNACTYVCSLKACGNAGNISRGQSIHAEIVKSGLDRDQYVGSSLVDVYAKSGSLQEAQDVLDNMRARDVVSWTALITGYADYGFGEEALTCLEQMQAEGICLDFVTLICSLKACGSVGATDRGRLIHSDIFRLGFEEELILGGSLVDMYARCGLLVEARKAFESLSAHDIYAWNILIAGYAWQGECENVFNMLQCMIAGGIHPDGFTLLSILNVCCHTGLVDEGQRYFDAICREYIITPTIEHHNCVVDLFCRAGLLNEAVAIADLMPQQPDLVLWKTVLGACKMKDNLELGMQAFSCAMKLDAKAPSLFTLMSNIYACGDT